MMRGLWNIFCFSLRQKLSLKGFRVLTIVVAVILFLIPVVLLPIIDGSSDTEKESEFTESYGVEEIKSVFSVIEHSERAAYLKNFISYAEATLPQWDETASGIRFTICDDLTQATEQAQKAERAVILRILENDERLLFNTVLPEGSALPQMSAESLAGILVGLFQDYRIQEMNLTPAQQELATAPLSVFMPFSEEEEVDSDSQPAEDPEEEELPEDPAEAEKEQQQEYLQIMLPTLAFLNIMIIYFLVLYHNRDIGQIVILEKSSKLMDTFLISVKPRAMIFGKVLSVWLSALIQFAVWILALVAGLVVGANLAQRQHPDSPSLILLLLKTLRESTRFFSLPNVLLALLLVAVGFLVYMVMAAIFSSFASRQEDLSASQGIFNMTLVISYFVALSHFMNAGEAGAAWYDFIPFISCMLTPARILAGTVSLSVGFAATVIGLLLALLFAVFAGMIYNMMSLYKGDMPKLKDVMKMLRTQK